MLLGEIFGPDLLVVIIAGAVLLFGGAAIPKFARNLGPVQERVRKGHEIGERDHRTRHD